MAKRGRSEKKPKAKVTPRDGSKRPHAARQPDHDADRLAWRFARVDHHGPWPWCFTDEKLQEVLVKLGGLEGRKVGEVFGGPTKNKCIKVADLCADAQKRLRETRQDDLDEIWEFRIAGTERIWGTRSGALVDLIWWDPDHEVCPSKKKHT